MNVVISPAANFAALRKFTAESLRYRSLLWEMTWRDLFERHSGQMLGAGWVLGQPLMQMAVYCFVFAYLFQIRLGGATAGDSYIAYLLAGLVPWLTMQEALARAPVAIVDSRNLVKQLVFPAEVLPLKTVLSTLVFLGVGLAFVIVIVAMQGWRGAALWWALPLPILSHLVMMTGISYALAAVGVFVRDIKNLMQLLLMVGLFVHPVVYTPSMVPAWLERLFWASPLSHVIWLYRDVLVLGEMAHPASWLLAPLLALVSLALGFRTFQALKHYFGDAL